MTLLMPREVDRLFRYPRGRSLRLAKAAQLPFIRLPDGEIRFDQEQINRVLIAGAMTPQVSEQREAAHA